MRLTHSQAQNSPLNQPTSPLAPPQLEATFHAEPTNVTVGDIFTLTLQIRHPRNLRPTPNQLESPWGPFEFRQIGSIESTQIDDSADTVTTQKFQATLWITGTISTPNLQISLVDESGTAQSIDVTPVTVTVESVLQAGDDTLRDIKPQAVLPYIPRWVQWGALALGLLLVLGLLFWWWRKRPAPPLIVEEPEPIVVDPRPADVKALEALQAIVKQNLPAQRRFADHYDQVTDVLRKYLDDGFSIPALDQTTSELKYLLPAGTIDATNREQLFTLLEEADWVKFAKVQPELNAANQLPERARQFVIDTASRLPKREDQP